MDPRHVISADVWKKDRLAGHLTRREDGSVAFNYDETYLDDPGPPVATSLPLIERQVVTTAGAVPPFFAGLLPEGARLTALVSAIKTSADDELSLLLTVGEDTVGDVRVVPAGAVPAEPSPIAKIDSLNSLDSLDFTELFDRSISPISAARERTGLPGVQVKVSAAMISFPMPGERYILKLEPETYPHLIENEAFFLNLAKEARISVVDAQVITDRNGKKGLLVRRFDRADAEGHLVRRGQEDVCQLAGLYPADKYRLTARKVVEVIKSASAVPLVDTLQVFSVMVFSYLIGNGDLHGKNLSLGESAEGEFRLTPIYDLLSSLPYLPNDHLAIAIDGKDDNLSRRHLLAFATAIGLPERAVTREIDSLQRTVGSRILRLREIGFDAKTTTTLQRKMEQRLNNLS